MPCSTSRALDEATVNFTFFLSFIACLQVQHIYTGTLDEGDELADGMLQCDPEVCE